MTIAIPFGAPARAFGAGGTEPYARALFADSPDRLHLVDLDTSLETPLDLARWRDEADAADLSMLLGVDGPVLDVGCGPGRMVRAALDRGLPALGVDISSAAVRLARSAGLPVLERSVFDTLPHADWSTILIADGNIGIGGDPRALLARCAELLAPGGAVIVESATDATADRRYVARVRDDAGYLSDEFPWADLGGDALDGVATAAGLRTAQSWSTGARRFSRIVIAST